MLRAGQQQIFQETNVRLVELRHKEIDYYFTVNAALGTQSVLIGGFAYGLFTKNVPSGHSYARTFMSAFYICSAITIFASIHVVIITVLLQVYGPGLALHGPAGSMARAAEVMLDEQTQVMIGFIVMMFFFAISTVLCFWVAMDIYSSIICTVIFVIALRQWLYYWRRVYFKLYWDKSRAKAMFADVHANSDEPTVRPTLQNTNGAGGDPSNNQGGDNDDTASEVVERQSIMSQTRQSIVNLFTRPSLMGKQQSGHPDAGTAAANPMQNLATKGGAVQYQDPKELTMEGYMAKKTLSSRRSIIAGSSMQWGQWERRYCTLTVRGVLSTFKTRQEYRSGEDGTKRDRPMELEDYWVYFDANVPGVPAEEMDDARSVTSGTSASTGAIGGVSVNRREIFRITLLSKDEDVTRKFIFRCDTEEELNLWRDAIQRVAPQSIAAVTTESYQGSFSAPPAPSSFVSTGPTTTLTAGNLAASQRGSTRAPVQGSVIASGKEKTSDKVAV